MCHMLGLSNGVYVPISGSGHNAEPGEGRLPTMPAGFSLLENLELAARQGKNQKLSSVDGS